MRTHDCIQKCIKIRCRMSFLVLQRRIVKAFLLPFLYYCYYIIMISHLLQQLICVDITLHRLRHCVWILRCLVIFIFLLLLLSFFLSSHTIAVTATYHRDTATRNDNKVTHLQLKQADKPHSPPTLFQLSHLTVLSAIVTPHHLLLLVHRYRFCSKAV